jgi:hypothetical protein
MPSPQQVPINIHACTTDQRSVGYLKQIDQDPNLFIDVTDAYQSQMQTIQRVHGPDFTFSMGDYTLKCLLGGADPWMDKLDEPTLFSPREIAYHKYGQL